MRILAVLDLMGGEVVRGIAGRRSEYRPIRSRVTDATTPHDVARALRDRFNLHELYVADLDAIAGRPPALPVLAQLARDGFELLVDAGIRTVSDCKALVDLGVVLVAGLETLQGPSALAAILKQVGPDQVVFSLDLRDGRPLNSSQWVDANAVGIASHAVSAIGVQRLLLLDLARVGVGTGTGTIDLCRELRSAYPKIEILTGGGVSGPDDLRQLAAAGVDGVLVASALHDGRLTPCDMHTPSPS